MSVTAQRDSTLGTSVLYSLYVYELMSMRRLSSFLAQLEENRYDDQNEWSSAVKITDCISAKVVGGACVSPQISVLADPF